MGLQVVLRTVDRIWCVIVDCSRGTSGSIEDNRQDLVCYVDCSRGTSGSIEDNRQDLVCYCRL